MPFIPVPSGIKAEMRYTQDGQRLENVFWFIANDETPSPSDLHAVADMLNNWWVDEVRALQASAVTLREIYVSDQSSVSGAVETYTTDLPATGINVNTPEPNSVTICVSLRTAKRGRSYRGRSYVVGITTNTVIASRMTAVALAAWLAAYDTLISTAASAGLQMAVCSLYSGGLPRAAGVLTPINDAVIVDDVVDNQRRRLPGRGM